MKSIETILIVDDEPTNVDMLSQELEEEGYHLLSAYDGEEALIKVQEHQPDLVLLDIMMPEMNGIELCNSIKDNFITGHIPVILLTAKAAIEQKIEGLLFIHVWKLMKFLTCLKILCHLI